MISSTYNSVIPEDYDRVTYGEPSYNPATAHGLTQWTTDSKEPVYNNPDLLDQIGDIVELSEFGS